MKYILKVTLLLLLTSLATGCAQKGPRMPLSLDEALQRQKSEPNKAIVLGTVESEGRPGGFSEGMGAFLFGKQRVDSAIVFAGNPYGPKPEAIQKIYDSQELTPLAYGTFSLTEGKDWAYVEPRKYAIYKFRNHENKIADFRAWARNDRMAYLVFDVNPGEIIYIGHIKARFNEGPHIELAVEDRFEEFKADQSEAIKQRLTKRVIKAPALLFAEEVLQQRIPVARTMFIPVYH